MTKLTQKIECLSKSEYQMFVILIRTSHAQALYAQATFNEDEELFFNATELMQEIGEYLLISASFENISIQQYSSKLQMFAKELLEIVNEPYLNVPIEDNP